ncbi:MAG: histidinol-phosphate transaminase [Bacteroidota bacterium]
MELKNLVRENILRLKPYTSARDEYSEGILLDANENSFGSVVNPEQVSSLNRYPDPHQKELREGISKLYGYDYGKLFFGVGSDELIDLLIRIFCVPGKDKVMIVDPTYGMYKVACDINDVETVSVRLNDEFQIDHENISTGYSEDVKIIFMCSPNNPTGNLLRKEDIKNVCRTYNSIVVVDEAYIDFAADGSVAEFVGEYNNLVILRTFSKAWGLAGVRLGYCIADEFIIRLLFNVKAPYNVNSMTRKVFLDALDNVAKKEKFVSEIISERQRLAAGLSEIPEVGRVYPSDANYILFTCPDAGKVQKHIAGLGLIIRDRSSNVKNALRITVGTPEENDAALRLLRQTLSPSEDRGEPMTAEDIIALGKKNNADASVSLAETEICPGHRSAEKRRKTKETDIAVKVCLDGSGKSDIKTGIGFFDHMLDQIARHSNIDLYVSVKGDLNVDEHHTVEDTGITLGETLLEAFGDKRGIMRYGFFLPMDDSIARCALDVGGRTYLNFNCKFKRNRVGEFPTELTEEFFRALASGLKANIYLKAKGKNDHHKIEGLFKAFAKSLNGALQYDARNKNGLPSTKGLI